MNWPFLLSLVINGYLMYLLYVAAERTRELRDTQHRLNGQVKRRDFLIQELKTLANDIDEHERYPVAVECPACGEIAFSSEEIIDSIQKIKCNSCGYLEYPTTEKKP